MTIHELRSAIKRYGVDVSCRRENGKWVVLIAGTIKGKPYVRVYTHRDRFEAHEAALLDLVAVSTLYRA